MAPVDAPSHTVLPVGFLDEVMYLLRRLVVHGEEQQMLFRVMDTASRVRHTSTSVKSCDCSKR
jgi:hypothetical protein